MQLNEGHVNALTPRTARVPGGWTPSTMRNKGGGSGPQSDDRSEPSRSQR